MQIRAEPEKSALPICNYSQILYQFLTFTQNLKRSQSNSSLVLWVLANYIFAVISHLRASFPAVLLLSVRLMAGHIKETFILLFTMAGACLIVFLVPGLFVLFPGILCGIASHLIEPGLKKALAID